MCDSFINSHLFPQLGAAMSLCSYLQPLKKINVHLIKADNNTKLSSHLEGNVVDTSCLFNKTTIVDSIGDPQPWRNQWPNLQYQAWSPDLGMGIHTNPNVIGNHHKRLATTTTVHILPVRASMKGKGPQVTVNYFSPLASCRALSNNKKADQ